MSGPAIGFAGLTHLGLVSAAAAAATGFSAVGFDPDEALVSTVADGRLPVVEPGLPELIAGARDRLSLTSDASDLSSCDVVYIAADVPTDGEGRSDLGPIRALIDKVTAVLDAGSVMVVLSQVPPGFTRGLNLDPRRLFYQVETLVFGRAVERATRPERFIVGCAEPATPLPAPLHAFLRAFDCPVMPMRYESAELAKISINLCLAASISTANTLAEICEQIGADWSEIAPALKLDERIGPHAYLSAGLGIAGGNLERDLAAVQKISTTHGTDAGVVDAMVRNSGRRKDWACRVLRSELLETHPDASVAVLGLAYKPDTASTKNSPALKLLDDLDRARVAVYDPVVPWDAAGSGPRVAGTAMEAIEGADAVAVMTAWPEFATLDAGEVAEAMRGRTIVDPWGIIDGTALVAAGLDYFRLGSSPMRARSED